MFCLNQFNTFIKKINFEFGYYCVCNENKFTNELMICDTSNLHSDLKYMKNLLKMILNIILQLISNLSQKN
jgi:uncharacterized membrane protein YjgN (DUF898 family)